MTTISRRIHDDLLKLWRMNMPIFITQGRFTADAMRGMMARPENRGEAVAQLFAKSGGKLLSYYMTFGDYDFLIVSEGPCEEIAIPAIVAAAGGGVTDLKICLALPSNEMKGAFAKAANVAGSFQSAGG